MTTDQLLTYIAVGMGAALCVAIVCAIKNPRRPVMVANHGNFGKVPKPAEWPPAPESFCANDTHPNQPVRDCIADIRREQGFDGPIGPYVAPTLDRVPASEMFALLVDVFTSANRLDPKIADRIASVIHRARSIN